MGPVKEAVVTCLGIGAVEVKLFTGFAVVEFAVVAIVSFYQLPLQQQPPLLQLLVLRQFYLFKRPPPPLKKENNNNNNKKNNWL